MVLGGFRPSDDPFASWFGRVQVALPHETWPMHANRPMTPLCQINCAELPYRPDTLADIALITLFADLDKFPYGNFDAAGNLEEVKANGDTWLLRAYPSLDGLVRIQQPALHSIVKPYCRPRTT